MTAWLIRPISYLRARNGSMSQGDSDLRRKRLRWRSWRRGTREVDLLLGGFADAHLANMDEEQLDRFERLLDLPDPDLYAWIVALEQPPQAADHGMIKLIQNFKFKPTSG